jgi:hypothetical protein
MTIAMAPSLYLQDVFQVQVYLQRFRRGRRLRIEREYNCRGRGREREGKKGGDLS